MTENIHRGAKLYAREYMAGKLGRREFLTRATALGVAVPVAYGLVGLAGPIARADTPQRGGTLRMQMDIRAQKDPRTWDWSELANVCRGWLEYLVQYNRDGTLTPKLLADWEANEDATEYLLHVRQGVTWNNGDAFTAADVVANLERWCDTSVEGNSMAGRMAAISQDGRLRDGAAEIVDDHTVRLHLSAPDIALIPNFADYPAAVVHPSFPGGNPFDNPIGTGPYRPVSHETGIGAVLERNPDHSWWNEGQGGWLDRIEFVDLGTDPASWLAAAESGEVDILYESMGDFLDILDAIGMVRSEAVTASTICVRFNQEQEPYTNRNVRRALQLAVDNALVLELGYNDLGEPAENHHVCPIHPEYAELPPLVHDPAEALALFEAEGLAGTTLELISVDEDWQSSTCDNVAAQIPAAGIAIDRTILPGATFWNDWTKYPFSATNWAMRPLGVQVMALAYRSGEAWNETAFANEEFDALLGQAMSIADADERREVMAQLQTILQDEGVVIQPYWRSLFRHARPHVKGADMHPTFEVHVNDYWLDA